MRCRAVTSDGDLLPVAHAIDMDIDEYAVADSAVARMRLLYGEWFEDREVGFRVPQFIFNGEKKTMGSGFLKSYIAAYIEKTEGVTNVELEENDTKNKRELNLNATITTIYNETVTMEVNENVLLQAIY